MKVENWVDIKRRAKEAPLEMLASTYLDKPRRYGNNITSRCPFHKERTGSFVIYLTTNSFYCFGCHISGDAITFVMKTQGIEFKDAVRRLA
jgi:DNA primase